MSATTLLGEAPARPATRSPHPVIAALAATAAGLPTAVAESDSWVALDSLLTALDVVSRATATAAQLLARVEGDGLWALGGGRSVTDWLTVAAGLPRHQAADLVQLSRALRNHLPATAEAVVSGRLPVSAAQILAKHAVTSPARQEALRAPAEECGEPFLLAQAGQMPADSFRAVVKRWAAAADPEADERGYRDASEREFVTLAATTGGFHLAGFLTTDHGAVLGTALDAMTPMPAPDDHRTAQQRRAGALTDLARLALERGLAGTGAEVRPHLSVVVDYETLARTLRGAGRDCPGGDPVGCHVGTAGSGCHVGTAGSGCRVGTAAAPGSALFRLAPVADIERFAVAEVLGAGPIPPSVLARLACDGELTRVVFGPDSQVINVGRAERTFTGPRRRAMIARDQTCRYPGCNAPPALGELHHLDWWARDGGETDTNAGVLLCWYHHEIVHRLEIAITRSATGGWTFTTRHGDPVPR